MPTKEQLQKRVRELEAENDELQYQLDQIFDIVAPEVGGLSDGDAEDKHEAGRRLTPACESSRQR